MIKKRQKRLTAIIKRSANKGGGSELVLVETF
jgi:hypothetical protein